MENKYSIFEEPRDRPKVIECANYLDSLFSRAFSKEPFGVLCTLLRLNGLQDQNWDPFEESMKMFGDYNWLREKAKKANSDTCANRIALLIYCHAIEMTAPHEMLSNLLRCLGGKSYVVKPFGHLTRVNKKQSFSWVPPSAKMKFRELKSQANDAKEEQLANYIDNFFNDDIRNAVSHSDYIITPDAFRFTESGLPRQIPNEKLSETINNGFAFYDALLGCQRIWKKEFSHLKKYHKWPNYEVLEILSNDEIGVFGFNVHFSNGNKATFSRSKEGVDATNINFEEDGSISFMIGSFDKLETKWKIDGKEVSDWSEFPVEEPL